MPTATASVAQPAKDNLLGICNAIGGDFGFNPLWLRIPLAAMIIFSPMWMMIAYAAMGVAVLASRLLVRTPRAAKAATAPMAAPAPAPVVQRQELALAA